jgi:lysophospholipase L1-like esterase
MKKLIKQILLLTLLPVSLAVAQSKTKNDFTVVCLGDSITRAGYPVELEKILGVRVINAGVNGNSSREGLARLEKDVLVHHPNVVVLFFGANDGRVDAPKKYVPLVEYEKNLSTIVERCLQAGAKVILGTMPPIDPEPYFTRHVKKDFDAIGGLEKQIRDYRAAALRVGESKKIPVVDLNQLLLKESTWRLPDGVHPTEEGNRIIAQLFAKEIEPLLGTKKSASSQHIGVGAKPIPVAEMILDGSREMLDAKWTYWEGPRFSSSLPIKWKIVEDPVDKGTVVQTDDPAAAGGKYGTADIVTKKAYRDFRLHIEFLVNNPRGNSGVYLQNRYEIQIMDGDKTSHGMGAVINESESPYHAYNGLGKWNAYDINFRAARFKDGKLVEKPLVTMYFNGIKVHTKQTISQVWGGANSGIDGGNDGGKGITDTPGGLKLQCEGHDVRYRNAWIKEMDLEKADTDF